MKRNDFRQAIRSEVHSWKMLSDKLEIQKAMKKMRMLYGHLSMWEEKMSEVYETDQPSVNSENKRVKTNVVENPLSRQDINRKQDKDFVYF